MEKLFRRRWVFDPNPLQLPTGFGGNVFRSSSGSWVASVVSVEPRLPGRGIRDNSVCVRTTGIDSVERVTLSTLGEAERQVPFRREQGALLFDVPGNAIAAVAELHGRT